MSPTPSQGQKILVGYKAVNGQIVPQYSNVNLQPNTSTPNGLNTPAGKQFAGYADAKGTQPIWADAGSPTSRGTTPIPNEDQLGHSFDLSKNRANYQTEALKSHNNPFNPANIILNLSRGAVLAGSGAAFGGLLGAASAPAAATTGSAVAGTAANAAPIGNSFFTNLGALKGQALSGALSGGVSGYQQGGITGALKGAATGGVAGAVGAGNAVSSGLGTYAGGGSIKDALISGVGNYAGNAIGKQLYPDAIGSLGGGTDSMGPFSFGDLGGTALNTLGNTVANTSIGGALGGIAGNAIAKDFMSPEAPQGQTSSLNSNSLLPASFTPTQGPQLQLPGSLSGLDGLDTNQQTSNLATQGVYGGGLGPEEQSYFTGLVNNQLVDKSGNVGDIGSLSPIENSYLSQLGFGGYSNSNDLLGALSKWKQGTQATA